MEIESVNTKANAGLTTGIIGTALATLGSLGGILGAHMSNSNNSGSTNNEYITRSEFNMGQELARKDSEIALLKSEQNTEIKIADVYERIMTRVNADRREQDAWNAQQSVNNATMSAAIASNAASIAALQSSCSQITKLVVPNTAICPGWGNVTVAPATATA